MRFRGRLRGYEVPKGKKDNTHYNVYGAHVVANALADALSEQVPALEAHIDHIRSKVFSRLLALARNKLLAKYVNSHF